MSITYYAHICKRGHVLIERHPISKLAFCEKCGAELLDKCPSCQSAIKSWVLGDEFFLSPRYDRPSYCRNCGSPYPWTTAAIDATTLLIEEDSDLDAELQGKIIETLPDIIAETPETNLAVARLKKAFMTVGKFTADGLRQFVIDFGCELAKHQLFP